MEIKHKHMYILMLLMKESYCKTFLSSMG